MLNNQFKQLTSIQTIDNIILVGERHYDYRSMSLVQSVLGSLPSVSAIAVERSESSLIPNVETGIDIAEEYAKRSQTPCYHIDKSSTWLRDRIAQADDGNWEDVINDGNMFSSEPYLNGDVDIETICQARDRIYMKYGRDVFDALYIDREKYMTEQLQSIPQIQNSEGCVVVVVGVFHILALKQLLELYIQN